MRYEFVILDEVIEDLLDGHSGKKIHAINRIVGLRNKRHTQIKNLYWQMDCDTVTFLEYNRIVRRLYSGDVKEAITMLRELQDELAEPGVYYHIPSFDVRSATYRFIDWKVKTLHESSI